jgi:Zn-dependent protease
MIRTDLIKQKWQQSLVALAGPAMSLINALVCYWVAQAVSGTPLLYHGLMLLTFFLMMAFVLNILPIPGLDGFAALRPYLPQALTSAVPPQVGGLVIIAALLGVFFFGYRIVMPLVMGAAALIGMDLDLAQIGDAMDRFQFWR